MQQIIKNYLNNPKMMLQKILMSMGRNYENKNTGFYQYRAHCK